MKLPATDLAELQYRDGSLGYCGMPVSKIAETTGTPAFVYSEAKLLSNLEAFRRAFSLSPPWGLRLAYSVKTAWEPRLLAAMAGMGAEAEVACEHELELALRAGFRPQDIILDGPAHHPELVVRAAQIGIRYLKIDSLDQLRLAAQAAAGRGRVGICLRIRAPVRAAVRPLAFLERRFGMERAELKQALALLAGASNLELRGLAVHVGSQIASPKTYRQALAALAAAGELAGERLSPGAEVNLGGGFPSATLRRGSLSSWLGLPPRAGKIPRLEEYGRAVRRGLAESDFPLQQMQLVLEPGRALVGDAAILLCRVVAAKRGWLVTDASRNFVPESLLFASRRFFPAQPRRGLPWSRANLAGCTLHGGDILALGCRLPGWAAGDLLVMMDAGAYTLSRANRFTTLVPPAYLLGADGRLQPWRRKESAQDVVEEAGSW